MLQSINMQGRDQGLKSVYSNAVEAKQFAFLKDKLVALGFKRLHNKQSASVHVNNMDLNTSLVVSFKLTG